ncbi:MAG: endonuclease, partial [Campylobacteraceae bacterium]|nr:endonuclease [Campylobacteraceae bacterium]
TNLEGIYKKAYLHYKKDNIYKKIRLYAKDKELLPKNGQKVHIIQAHLSYFKNNTQIIINKKSEYNAY